jgi:hypothetical protein
MVACVVSAHRRFQTFRTSETHHIEGELNEKLDPHCRKKGADRFLALQLLFLFEMSASRLGLVSAAP